VVRPGGGPIKKVGNLSLVYPIISAAGKAETAQAKIEAKDFGKYYAAQACIFDLPAGKTRLTPAELDVIERRPLAIMLTATDGTSQVVLRETPGGLYVRADQIALRLSPRERRKVSVYATKYGVRYAGARVLALLDGTLLQASSDDPPVGTPTNALRFLTKCKTGRNGHVSWPFWACNPGSPRKYIDGQVYGVRFALVETMQLMMKYPFDYASFTHFLVWSEFPNPPQTWHDGIKDIFTLYANLFPVMKRMVDLSDYDTVVKRAAMIAYSMSLDFNDANYMPVSRDLSPAKLQAVLAWLKNPVKGTPKPSPVCSASSTGVTEEPEAKPEYSGKASAFARTLLVQAQEREL